MTIRFISLFTASILSLGAFVQAQEIRISGAFSPMRTDGKQPKIRVLSEDGNLRPNGQGSWVYEPKDATKLIGSSSVAFEQSPPEYMSEQLMIRLPSGRSQPLYVALYGVQIQDTNQRIREIFALNIKGKQMRTEDLFRLYQEAAFLSIRRLNAIQQEKRELYVYDVQIFFKYLEIARELGRSKFVAVSENVLRVATYLREQKEIEEGKSAIVKGFGIKGPEMVDTLLTEIDFVDAEQLRLVWQSLTTTPPSFTQKSCEKYKAFAKTLEGYDDLLVKRWDDTKDFKMATLVAEALATCASAAEADAASFPVAAKVAVGELSIAAEAISKKVDGVRIQKSTSEISQIRRRLNF
ncbi:hypothetical protein LP414_09400 [Polaromonas sp. P1(28)-13]|nr:hypothetical protein LP414_09400 [Polaromonas sp. P1(28)-13]